MGFRLIGWDGMGWGIANNITDCIALYLNVVRDNENTRYRLDYSLYRDSD